MAEAIRICSVPGCGKPHQAKGYCRQHYQRFWKYGDPSVCKNPIGVHGPICSVEGCAEPHHAYGFCSLHAYRFRAHGTPGSAEKERMGGREPAQWIREHVHHVGDECLIAPFGKSADGYSQVTVGGETKGAHRYMCELVNGPPPTPHHVTAHSCGRGHLGCVSPKHVRWATESENNLDKHDHGTMPRGEVQWHSVLTERDVREIRRLRGIERQVDLAARFGVRQATISAIQLRRSWAWLD